eukprot:m51a1_g4128 putative myosin light chain (414) ;mRNA; f:184771-186942
MSENEEVVIVRVIGARNVEKRRASSLVYVRLRCGGKPFVTAHSSEPHWDQCFSVYTGKVGETRPPLTVRLMERGTLIDDTLAEGHIDLNNDIRGEMNIWVKMDKKKGAGDVNITLCLGGLGALNQRYAIGGQIGSGAFSVVHGGVDKATGRKVAVKIIDKRRHDPSKLRLLEREIEIMRRVKHPNVVELYDIFVVDPHVYLIMEMADGGPLYDEIVQRGSYNEADAANVMRQILSATAYLHENGIAHRDLKPENLLLVKGTEYKVIISDFGLSKDFVASSPLMTCVGSPSYVAPEIINGDQYDSACDIWSLGVICYVLLSGYMPFFGASQEQLYQNILTGNFKFSNKCWANISQEAKNLIVSMLTVNRARRPTAAQCLDHPWFKAPGNAALSANSLRGIAAGGAQISPEEAQS